VSKYASTGINNAGKSIKGLGYPTGTLLPVFTTLIQPNKTSNALTKSPHKNKSYHIYFHKAPNSRILNILKSIEKSK
jgi:hypothetical protein